MQKFIQINEKIAKKSKKKRGTEFKKRQNYFVKLKKEKRQKFVKKKYKKICRKVQKKTGKIIKKNAKRNQKNNFLEMKKKQADIL